MRAFVNADGAEPVLFEPAALRSLVAELIENAVRSLAGVANPEIRVTVARVSADSRWLMVRVADNGPGIARERRESVFGGRDAMRANGGFGLAHARAVAASWLGDLSLADVEGPGAAFELHVRRLCAIEGEARGHRRGDRLLEGAAR